jgi:hypothetical protein
MANTATRIVIGGSSVPSRTFAAFTCAFDGASGVVTPVLTSGVDFTFYDTNGVLVGPVAYWYTFAGVAPTALQDIGIVLAAGPPATVTLMGVAAGTHTPAICNGILFLIGPGCFR